MRALVIGAGAIGQVFGWHLQKGGAQVGFLVRPRQLEAARAGYTVYPLNRPARDRGKPLPFNGFEVYDDQDVALSKPWDLVVFAMSSVALRSGDWLARFGPRSGDAAVLVLQPSPEDKEVVLAALPPSRIATGMLAVVSYQTPLPGDTLEPPGVAWWFPWLAGIGFSGADRVVDLVTTALGAGGMPVRRLADVHTEVAFTGAILDKTVTALQVANWSFTALRSDRALMALAHRSMVESWTLATATTGQRTPRHLAFVRPALLRGILALAGWILPFDLERFFHYHYVKVQEQSLLLQDRQLARFEAAGIPCPATRELALRMRAALRQTADQLGATELASRPASHASATTSSTSTETPRP